MNPVLRHAEAALRTRTTASSCVLFLITLMPLMLVQLGLQAHALSSPEVLELYRPGDLALAQWGLSALIVWQCALTAVACWRRPELNRRICWGMLAVGPAITGWLVLAFGYGLKDTPLAMSVVSMVVCARAFFDWRVLRPWMVFWAALTVAYEVLVRLGLLDYAFLLTSPVFVGHNLSSWWDLWNRVIFNVTIWPFSAMVFFLFGSLARQRVELESLARTDMLTGLANRREFMARLSNEAHRHVRGGQSLSVVMIDVDHFKQINDTRGHPAGDHVLAELGQLMAGAVRRDIDVAARLGGEEFALLLPDTDVAGAQHVAEKVSERLARLNLSYQGEPLSVTLSMGISQVVDGRGDLALRLADDNLYVAKRQGRNQVVATMPGELA